MAYDGKASVRAESPRFRNRQSPKLAKPHHAGGGGGKEPALRGVNAQRGTSAATTGPRGARSTPKRGSPRGVGSAPPNPDEAPAQAPARSAPPNPDRAYRAELLLRPGRWGGRRFGP